MLRYDAAITDHSMPAATLPDAIRDVALYAEDWDAAEVPPHGATGQGRVCFAVEGPEGPALDDWRALL